MPRNVEWEIPTQAQPKPGDCAFDLDHTLSSVVGLHATVPDDAFTAPILGTERTGSGVLIRDDGLILTIGYLVTEAESIWLSSVDDQVTPGHVLAYDQETGFGLVQALGRISLPALRFGTSSALQVGDPVIVAAGGGRRHSVRAHVVAQQEFAGYWEYLIDGAIFTAPAHPFWGGTALIGRDGTLNGIGSLHVQQSTERGTPINVNMVVPIDLLEPIFNDLLSFGRPNRPPRPWLGLYSAESGDHVVVAGIAEGGPAHRAGVQVGDAVLAVRDKRIADLPSLYRRIWATGNAGAEIPLVLFRDGQTMTVRVKSADRQQFLRTPSMH